MKLVKNPLFTFILGIIISGSVVFAATQISASEIEYDSTHSVKDKIDDLYTTATTFKNLTTATTAVASDILTGKTAYDNNGNLITGNYTPNSESGNSLETEVLWTNPNPTANFAAQTITLSDNLSNYRYFKIIYNTNPNHAQNHEFIAIFSPSDLYPYATNALVIGGRNTDGNNGVYMRGFGSSSDNTIQFGLAGKGNETGSSSSSYMVPKQIIGIK